MERKTAAGSQWRLCPSCDGMTLTPECRPTTGPTDLGTEDWRCQWCGEWVTPEHMLLDAEARAAGMDALIEDAGLELAFGWEGAQ